MNNCKYLYNGTPYQSFDDLVKALMEGDLTKELSIVFKLDRDIQAELADIVWEKKKDYLLKHPGKQVSLIDENPDIDTHHYTTQTFIDKGPFTINGEAPIFRKSNEEYLKRVKTSLMNDQNFTEQEADAECTKIKEKEENIAKAAYDLHKIVVGRDKDDPQYFRAKTLKTAFQGMGDKLAEVTQKIEFNAIKSHSKSKLIRNISLEAELKGLAETIVGHIDYMVIRKDGVIEIYNIKASHQSFAQWDTIKKEKFKWQLALLKRILAANGISARDIRLNIIPAKLDFDPSYSRVTDITVEDTWAVDQRGYKYIFQHYDNIAAQFIDVPVSIEDMKNDDLDRVNEFLKNIIPEKSVDVRADGIHQSIENWVQKHWDSIATPAKDKVGWDITLPDSETIYIEDPEKGTKNAAFMRIIEDRAEELLSKAAIQKTTQRIIADIESAYEGNREFVSTKTHNPLLEKQFAKYFKKDSRGEYMWELVKGQEAFNQLTNLVLFVNKSTKQLDILSVTPFDLGLKTKFKGRKHLLGHHLPSINKYNFTLQANYGNIEAVRIMTMLNQVIGSLPNDIKLGQIKLVSLNQNASKKGADIDMGLMLPHFDTIVKVVNTNNQNLKMPNNFNRNGIKGVDPSRLVIQSWQEAMAQHPETFKALEDQISGKTKLDGTVIDALETVEIKEAKIDKLNNILDQLQVIGKELSFDFRIGQLQKQLVSDTSSSKIKAFASVYMSTLKALNMYNGDLSIENESFNDVEKWASKPQSIRNSNIKTVAQLFQRTINNIAIQMMDRYAPIRVIIYKYLEDSGYTKAQNYWIGNKAHIFANLYDPDKQMTFKDPYNLSTDLKGYERQFLKDILWEINKIRYEMQGRTWNFTSKEDPKLIENVNFDYLKVPLERASDATRRSQTKSGFVQFGKRITKMIKDPKEAFEEYTEGLLSNDEKLQKDLDFENLQAYNPFLKTEVSNNTRAAYINSKTPEYFETDVENILIDFMEKHIQSVEYNKMLVRAKGVLLDLYLRGESGENEESVNRTIDTIQKFLSVSVYNRSIMKDTEKAMDAWVKPIRSALTKCYVALNPVGAMRDTLQGLQENIIRSLTKFQTDIDVKDVIAGYKDIVTEGVNDPMKISVYNQLNIKFRLSNLDVARISEGFKTGRSGILNYENVLYSTLRGPDYLNRMVLFSARLHHDGADKAYSIDKETNKLKYDYRLDDRFSIYASGDTSHKDYHKQRGQYLSLLRAFNKERNIQLVEGDDLPDAYTLQEVESFKSFADNIYGSYNQSTKQMMEHTAIGRNFLVFATWMNGIVDVYWKRTQISATETTWEQEVDEFGNKLYFDSYGNIVTLEQGGNEEMPVMQNVPVMVQGVFQTLHELYSVWNQDGFDAMYQVWHDCDIYVRNMNRIITDMTVIALQTLLYSMAINPAYEEHKKKDKGDEIAKNLMFELLYKSASKSYDTFMGPLAVLDYIGNSTNPAAYQFIQTKVFDDFARFMFGDKTFIELVMGMSALPRSFNDTYQMWKRDNIK